jgi:RNA polymerase sigma-70 factor (ECF subfamily)
MDGGSEREISHPWEVADGRVDTEERYAQSERARHLKMAIHRLDPVLRTIIEIRQIHDTPIKEIAEIAGISIAATKSRLSRARAVLRRSLA